MAHSSKIYLGGTKSSYKEVTSYAGNVAAGLAVYLHSDGSIDTVASGGVLLGISLGKDLSDTSRTAVCRRGIGVPIKLTNGFTNNAIGAAVQISTTTGLAATSGTTVNAIYTSEKTDAVSEDGTAFADGCAYIDFQGGL